MRHRNVRTPILPQRHRPRIIAAHGGRCRTGAVARLICILAATCRQAAANYSQPLLVDVGRSLRLTNRAVSGDRCAGLPEAHRLLGP